MKFFSIIKKLEAPKLILYCFITAFIHILLYELWFTIYPARSEMIYKLGTIFSKISYSIIASSTFYLISVYIPITLPKRKRKRKILFNIYRKVQLIDSYISGLKFNLDIHGNEFQNHECFRNILNGKNPDNVVDRFSNWYEYLFYIKERLIDLIRSMTIYNEYLSEDLMHELILLEKQLLSPHSFEREKTLISSSLSFAEISIQELLVHNKHIQKIRETEFNKYEKEFDRDGKEYRKRYYE